MSGKILRGQIYWVNLDPTIGTETKKNRPAVIISNNVQNSLSQRFIIAPLTSNYNKVYPFEVLVDVKGKKGKIMIDQIRTVDIKRLGTFISDLTNKEISEMETAIKLVLALD